MALPTPTSNDLAAAPLVLDLCEALEAESIDYCHWKSNAFLHRSLSGENDLDLLIRRSDADCFSAVLQRLRFKAAETPGRALPGVLNFYGHEQACARPIHVHAHYQLIVGDDLTKNYRIPLEEAFLESSTREGVLRIPPPELELIVLVLRLALKHSTWDAALSRRTSVPKNAVAEVRFLQERVDDELLYVLLHRHLPFVGQQAFADQLRSLSVEGSLRSRARSGHRLTGDLSACARRPRWRDVSLKLWRRAGGIADRIWKRPHPRKRLAAGGALIAVVGADGAGKSTTVESLAAWLSRDFSLTRFHLGRPPASVATRCVRALGRLRTGALLLTRGRAAARREASPTSSLRMLHAAALARDRYRVYVEARRVATNGGLVVCDRFPLPQLTSMDAPRITKPPTEGLAGRLGRRLAARELRYYRAISSPDVLIVLRVDPDVAVARKPDEPADFVRGRWQQIWDIDWDALGAHVVDATRPEKDVLEEVKNIIWDRV
jgi:thymidylate kinase